MKSGEGFGVKDVEDVLYFNSLPDNWNYDFSTPSDTEIRVVVYCLDDIGITSDSTIINVIMKDKEVVPTKITDIVVTDGKQDYTLPSTN